MPIPPWDALRTVILMASTPTNIGKVYGSLGGVTRQQELLERALRKPVRALW